MLSKLSEEEYGSLLKLFDRAAAACYPTMALSSRAFVIAERETYEQRGGE